MPWASPRSAPGWPGRLGMPAVHLDLFITSLQPIQWLTADLKRVVDLRLDRGRPVIVEGVLALDALDQIGPYGRLRRVRQRCGQHRLGGPIGRLSGTAKPAR